MGLFFTLLFALTAYLAPETVFGSLAQYHIEVILAVITLSISLFSAAGSGIMRLPQTYALFGLSAAVGLSVAFNGWLGGGAIALMNFLPESIIFFFIIINFKKKSHLQLLIVVLLLVAFFIIYHGYAAVRISNYESPYLMVMRRDAAQPLLRTRGLSFLNDPNDLAQFLVGLLPITFILWVKGRSVRNLFFVYLPASVLIFGMFLTHSRGGMLALMAIAIFMARRKIGTVPSVVIGALIFIGLSAVGFTGGRDVSAGSGEDRMESWGVGLQLLRSHPIFGVGYRRYTEFYEITAHNTVVVCAAELGLVGLFCWVMFVLPTLRDSVVGAEDPEAQKRARLEKEKNSSRTQDLLALGIPNANPQPVAIAPANNTSLLITNSAKEVAEARSIEALRVPVSMRGSEVRSLDALRPVGSRAIDNEPSNDEIRRMSQVLVLSFVGFFTAGWFLSRAYTMSLFVNAGIAHVIYRMARERGIAPPPLLFPRAMKFAAITSVVLILAVYMILRLSHFLPGH